MSKAFFSYLNLHFADTCHYDNARCPAIMCTSRMLLTTEIDITLLQAAESPHQDVSPRETELAQHLCEHLLYRLRRQRIVLTTFGRHHAQLTQLSAILDDFSASCATSAPAQVKLALLGKAVVMAFQHSLQTS